VTGECVGLLALALLATSTQQLLPQQHEWAGRCIVCMVYAMGTFHDNVPGADCCTCRPFRHPAYREINQT
jgi:hypothetical protein